MVTLLEVTDGGLAVAVTLVVDPLTGQVPIPATTGVKAIVFEPAVQSVIPVMGEVADEPLVGEQVAQVQFTLVQQVAVKGILTVLPTQTAAGAVGETVGVKLGITLTVNVQLAPQSPS